MNWLSRIVVASAFLMGLSGTAVAQVAPDFSAAFSPSTIGEGAESRLTFTIDNTSGAPVTDLSFTNTLPAGVTIASEAQAATTCTNAAVNITAADTFALEDFGGSASVGGNSSCTLAINVTAATAGTYTNTSSDLTSSAGNSGSASDDLDVIAEQLQFEMAFSPSTTPIGAASRLTYTITNPTAAVVTSVAFTNTFPSGLQVANPSGATTDCANAILSATPGSSTVQLQNVFFTTATSCTVEVDVVDTGTAGTYVNSTSLTSSQGTSGIASDTLTVTGPSGELTLIKQFDRTSIGPGGSIEMQFTLRNGNASSSATSISFTDDLDAALSGLMASALPANGFCGPGSQVSGSSTLTFSSLSLDPRSFCTFSMTLDVPTSAPDGAVTNTTSTVSAQVDGSPVTGDPASASFEVVEATPLLTKSFTDDPVAAGDTATVEYTIVNPSGSTALTNIAFTDSLEAMANATYTDGFQINVCGSGSGLTTQNASGVTSLSLFGGNLPAGGSCTFTASLLIPDNQPAGDYVSTSSDVSSDGGTGGPATDTLTITEPALDVTFSKTFSGDPVLPGGTVTLEFSLSNDSETASLTDLSFTDDLDAMLTGAVATGLPASNVCGSGSTLSGTDLITLTGGTLAALEECTFSVTVQVPGGATAGSYPNTTSDVSGDAGGGVVTASGSSASDTLVVSDAIAVTGTKSFTDDPATAGGLVTLQFTLTNPNTAHDATGISFSDNLAGMGLPSPGLTLSGMLPSNPCGGGSTLLLSGTTTGTLFLTGGNLVAGDSCTFSAQFTVPADTAGGQYDNLTSQIQATVDGGTQVGPAMADTLSVLSPAETLILTKEFTDDPVEAGDTVTLQFSLDNSANTVTIDSADFTDDLGQMGFAATATADSGSCTGGGTWSVSGTTNLSVNVSNLPGGEICTFAVNVVIPSGAPAGIHTNTISSMTVDVGGNIAMAAGASDNLTISPTSVTFQKSVSGDPVAPGGSLTVTYTILTPASGSALGDIRFTDDFNSVISGLAANDLPKSDVCGSGSSLSGTTVAQLTSGNLTPPETCQFSLTLDVPASAAPGSYTTTSGNLLEVTTPIAAPASDSFDVANPAENLTFSLEYTDDPVFAGAAAAATYTITNPDGVSTVTDIGFLHDLAATIPGATFTAGTNSCGGSVSGTDTVTLSGGSLAPGGSCTITLDVNVPSGATASNYTMTTGTLSGSVNGVSGNAGTASDTLAVEDPANVGFTKSFTNDPIAPGASVTLQYTIDNSGSTAALAGLTFSEDLDSVITGMSATGLPNNNVCGTGSTLAATGSGFQLSGGNLAAGMSCTFSVSVLVPTSAAPGSHPSTSSALLAGSTTINAGASDTLGVSNPAENMTFALEFTDDPVFAGAGAAATYTLTNPSTVSAITDIGFAHDLAPDIGAGTTFSVDANACGGTVTGAGTLTLAGGGLAASGSCTIDVTVNVPAGTAAGDYPTTTGTLSGSVNGVAANAGTAMDTLAVASTSGITFTKTFTDDPAAPGGTVTVEYTLTNPNPTATLNDLNFTDDLDAALSGLQATGLPASNVCGSGSALSGTSTISLTGGTLAPDASCTFSATLQVPANAPPGDHVSTASALFDGSLQVAAAPSDTLSVSNPADNVTFALEFTDDPVFAGAGATARYTITNPDAVSTLTDVGFTHDYDAELSGTTVATGATTCSGATLTGGTALTVSGASVAPGTSCTVDVTVTVPAPTPRGTYTFTSGPLSASVNGVAGTAAPTSTDDLEVETTANITFAKSFADDPVLPGRTVTLSFTIENPAPTIALADLNFTDDLDAALTGLEATGLPASDVCGTGSTLSGTSTLALTGGSLAVGASCTFEVTLQVPDDAVPGDHINTASALSEGALQVADAPSDTLTIGNPATNVTFALEFTDDPIAPGTAATAQFTITNPDTVAAVDGLAFTMPVEGAVSGASASGATPASPCGGATVTGGTSLSFSGGSLAPGADCTFTVEITVPLDTAASDYPFTTSALDASSNGVATTVAAASDSLSVGEAPQFTITAGNFASSGPQGGPFAPASMSYVVENIGAFPLTFSVAADQPFIDLEDDGGAPTTGGTIPAGGMQTVVVAIDQTVAGDGTTYTAGTTYDGLVTFTNDSAPAPGNTETREADLVVEQFGQVTIVQTTVAGDGTFGFSSTPSSALGTPITTTDGYGENEVTNLLAGSYVVTQDPPEGFGLVSLTCTEAGGTGNSTTDVDTMTATINLEPGETVICTFESANSRGRTTEVINRFLQRRVDMILSNEPGQNRRIDRLRNRFGGGASGTGTPFDVSAAQAGTNTVAMTFETSVAQIRAAYAAQDQAKQALIATSGVFANNPNGVPPSETLWDVWFRGSVTWFEDNTGGTDSDGFFAIMHAGADYLLTDRILIGALVQLDYLDQEFTTLGASADGVGWMAGPYATMRLTDNLYFDTRAAWGTSENQVSPFNTYTDDFTTTRWLVRAGLIGDWQLGNWSFRPSANVAYMEEHQEAYTDSLNVAIPSQTVGLGQFDFGPQVSYSYTTPDGFMFEPNAKLTGIWNFSRNTSGVTTTTQSAGVEMRAKVELGLKMRMRNGVRVEASGSYDGIGAENYNAIGGAMKLTVPLN